jgi:hypothetical protein
MLKFAAALLLVVALAVAFAPTPAAAAPLAQYWLCLERCGFCSADALQQIAEISAHTTNGTARNLTRISFEAFDLGSDSTVIRNPFFNATGAILAAGFTPIAMLTTVNMELIRAIDPALFATRVIAAARSLGVRGIDIDWEPSTTQPNDGKIYAHVIDVLSQRLAASGLTLSADIATWSSVWNFGEIAKTAIALPTLMSTYDSYFRGFERQLNLGLASFGANRVVVGMDAHMVPGVAEISERMTLLAQKGVCRVGFWQVGSGRMTPWWPSVQKFFDACVAKYEKAKN